MSASAFATYPPNNPANAHTHIKKGLPAGHTIAAHTPRNTKKRVDPTKPVARP